MRIVFSTHVSDDWYEAVGANKLITSAKHFHPDIPFVVFKSKEIQGKFESDESIHWDTLISPFCIDLAREYDLVVHFDADSCITDTLDEILAADYEVAGVRNNNDFGKAGRLPYSLAPEGTDPYTYINAGLVASTRLDFWIDWFNLNKEKAHFCPMAENDTLNEIFHSGKYKSTILDPKDSNIFYGTATQYGLHSHWDSWKFIKREANGLYLNDKKVKVLHHAGGHTLPKLKLNMFSPKVQNYISYIAAPPTLIDSKGNRLILKNENFIKILSASEKLRTLLSELNQDNLLGKVLNGKNNINILNIGANVGLHTLFVASRAKEVCVIETTKEYTNVMVDLIKVNNINNISLTKNIAKADLAIIDEYEMPENFNIETIIASGLIKSFYVITKNLDIVTKLINHGIKPEISGNAVYFNIS